MGRHATTVSPEERDRIAKPLRSGISANAIYASRRFWKLSKRAIDRIAQEVREADRNGGGAP